MGQHVLTLADLRALGRASVRAIDWCTATTPELSRDIWRFADDVTAASGDAHAAGVAPPGDLLVRQASYSLTDRKRWSANLWTAEEWENEENSAAWHLEIGQSPEPRFGVRLVALLGDGNPLTVAVESDIRVDQSGFRDMPKFVRWVRQNVPSMPDFRRVARSLDGYSRHIAVTISPSWAAARIEETVMAQIAEWCVRVAEFPHSRFPSLDADIYDWWTEWARRVGGRNSGEPILPGDVFEIAKKTVRAPTSAGHHLYWKKWLLERPGRLLETAAAKVGISKRSAYDRLRRGGRRLNDFSGADDPLKMLVFFLTESQPSGRLPVERRTLVEGLVEGGLKAEAARKLERRIRNLSQDEQARRVQRALRRAASGHA